MNMDIDAIHINIPRGIDLTFFSVLIVLISYTPFHLDFELLVPMQSMGTRFVSWLLPPIDTFVGRLLASYLLWHVLQTPELELPPTLLKNRPSFSTLSMSPPAFATTAGSLFVWFL